MIDLKTTFLYSIMSLSWLHEYRDYMYLVKKCKPSGKVKDSHWIDNGEWK